MTDTLRIDALCLPALETRQRSALLRLGQAIGSTGLLSPCGQAKSRTIENGYFCVLKLHFVGPIL